MLIGVHSRLKKTATVHGNIREPCYRNGDSRKRLDFAKETGAVQLAPEETNNLTTYRKYAAAVEKMAKQLDDWMKENEDTVRMEHEPYPLSEPYPGKQNRESKN